MRLYINLLLKVLHCIVYCGRLTLSNMVDRKVHIWKFRKYMKVNIDFV